MNTPEEKIPFPFYIDINLVYGEIKTVADARHLMEAYKQYGSDNYMRATIHPDEYSHRMENGTIIPKFSFLFSDAKTLNEWLEEKKMLHLFI